MPACFFRTGLVAALTVTATLTVAPRADAQDEGPGRRRGLGRWRGEADDHDGPLLAGGCVLQ